MLWSPLGESTRIVTPRRAGRRRGGGARDPHPARPPRRLSRRLRQHLFGVALAIRAARVGKKPLEGVHFPTIDDGVKGLAFIEAAVKSSKANGKWVKP